MVNIMDYNEIKKEIDKFNEQHISKYKLYSKTIECIIADNELMEEFSIIKTKDINKFIIFGNYISFKFHMEIYDSCEILAILKQNDGEDKELCSFKISGERAICNLNGTDNFLIEKEYNKFVHYIVYALIQKLDNKDR